MFDDFFGRGCFNLWMSRTYPLLLTITLTNNYKMKNWLLLNSWKQNFPQKIAQKNLKNILTNQLYFSAYIEILRRISLNIDKHKICNLIKLIHFQLN